VYARRGGRALRRDRTALTAAERRDRVETSVGELTAVEREYGPF